MTYASIGKDTSKTEVVGIAPLGIWLIYRGEEFFLDYDHFPWFADSPVRAVFDVREEGEGHLRWPLLDIDLSVDSLRRPEFFPLVYDPAGSYKKR